MLDELDIKILNYLQQHGRMKRNELAEKIGLSIPAISERMNKLEESGIIENYYAKLNRKKLGYDLMAFIMVVMESSKYYDKLITNLEKMDEIIECHSVLGEGSHMLKAIVKNTEELEKLLGKIQSWPGVVRTVTSFVLSTIKESTKLKL